MERFDVIVVGAGPAGATAGRALAQAGLNVLVVERAATPGAKNVSGGLLYSRAVAEVYPEFWKHAPIERAIAAHQIVMLGEHTSTALDFRSAQAATPPFNAFSVLRAKLDPWLATQAEEAGASLISGVNVDALLVENGRVVGIQAGPDQIGADVVVVAEGTAGLLLKQAGLRGPHNPHDVSLGVKEVIALPPDVIEERFQCDAETGAAYTLVGSTGGVEGGGFIYTNKASLSVGVVVKIDSLYASGRHPHEILDAFKAHPLVQRLVRGGEVVEYSAQTVHRGGFHLATQLVGDGYVVAGSAARLLVNNVLTLRGMDFAITSAVEAAQAILQARFAGSYTAATLGNYVERLKATSIYQDWRTFKDAYGLMENPRLFSLYPDLAGEVLERLLTADTKPGSKALGALSEALKGKASWLTLSQDMLQIARGMVL
ncbi:MAG TPA: FAD-dependent oxidoreductase [Anaerolineales bacterium]|nr:FAD-dependent oxidoreductase [Anaerolineales bacterium]